MPPELFRLFVGHINSNCYNGVALDIKSEITKYCLMTAISAALGSKFPAARNGGFFISESHTVNAVRFFRAVSLLQVAAPGASCS